MLTYLSNLIAQAQGDAPYLKLTPAARVFIDGVPRLWLQACRADEMGVQFMDQSAQWHRLHDDQIEIMSTIALHLSNQAARRIKPKKIAA